MATLKENTYQVLLIIISVLIAFSLDRWYESYQQSKNKYTFIQEQIVQFENEITSLYFYIDYNSKLIDNCSKSLQPNTNLDTIISNTRGLPNLTNFEPEFAELNELREVYQVDKFLSAQEKKELKNIYEYYSEVEFYENNYNQVIADRHSIFWRLYHNSHNKTFKDKTKFQSDEYLNIIESCRRQLINKNNSYQNLKEKLENIIALLQKI